MECSSGAEKHVGPIWHVVWVDQGPQKEEALITAAADGKVCQWQYTKAQPLSYDMCSSILSA